MHFSVSGRIVLSADLQSAAAPVLAADVNGNALELYTGGGEIVHSFSLSGNQLSLDSSFYEAAEYTLATIGGRTVYLETSHLERLAPENNIARSDVFYSTQTGFAGDRVSLLRVNVDGQDIFIAACSGQNGLQSFTQTTSGALLQQFWTPDAEDSYAADVSAMVSMEIDGQQFLFAASQSEAGVSSYVLSGSGQLDLRNSLGAEDGVGINNPSTLLATYAGETPVLLLGAAGTGTISVIGISEVGSLTLLDHIADDLETRFGGITVMETVTTGGWTFVVAGGSDDGLTLFALLPSGRLVVLDSFADNADLGLSNVNGLELDMIGDTLHIFATSETEPGVTHMTVDTSAGQMLLGVDGNHQLLGGDGDDILVDATGNDTLDGGAGTDLFVFGDTDETNTILNFNVQMDQIDLKAWEGLRSVAQLTIIEQESGAEIIFGNNRIILLTEDGASLTYEDFIQRDVLGLYRSSSPIATPLNLEGSVDSEELIGAAGGDQISGQGGDDTLYGQSGNDVLQGDSGHDTVFGGLGDDHLLGGTGHDNLEGGAGNDSIEGQSSYDILYGNEGNDSLSGGTGDDTLYGGSGDDELYGNTSLDTIYGGAGNDYISSGDGVDYVDGGDGNDIIYGRSGWDTLNGGAGNDSIYGSAGDDTLSGGADDDWLSGGSAWDVIYGDEGNDTLYGNYGSDVLSGGDGGDVLYGGTGDDSLHGGDGDDELYGNQGVDVLDGGAGDDLLRGGTLSDSFVFNTDYDHDEINDFEIGADILLLSTSLTDGQDDVASIIDTYATLTSAGVVFDFGDGDVLTLSNLTSLDGLASDISLF